MSVRRATLPWLVLLALALPLATATPVWAADPVTLELQAPAQVNLGDTVPVTVVLKDSKGTPVPGATVVLWSGASFLGTGGTVRLGRAATDAQGKATFLYEARTEGPITLNAYFSGDSRYDQVQASAKLAVQGSAQLYQETPTVGVPGVNWLVVGLLGGVWSTYFTVIVLLTFIARDGSRASRGAGGHRG